MDMRAYHATGRPLSHGERVGVRGGALSIRQHLASSRSITPSPYPSPHGRGDRMPPLAYATDVGAWQ